MASHWKGLTESNFTLASSCHWKTDQSETSMLQPSLFTVSLRHKGQRETGSRRETVSLMGDSVKVPSYELVASSSYYHTAVAWAQIPCSFNSGMHSTAASKSSETVSQIKLHTQKSWILDTVIAAIYFNVTFIYKNRQCIEGTWKKSGIMTSLVLSQSLRMERLSWAQLLPTRLLSCRKQRRY